MKLYFIAAVSQDDIRDSLDLFVWCKTSTEAVIYWRNYYDLDRLVSPDNIFKVPCEHPDGQRAGALRWGIDIVAEPELKVVR